MTFCWRVGRRIFMKVLIGLGNPGAKYKQTRHNAGFSVIDAISADKRIPVKNISYSSLTGKGRISRREVFLVKPETFMNLSGRVVKALVCKKGLELNDILIICDDVNLPLGNIRLRSGGSEGGHNGLKSISQSLKTRDYPRLRVGVGKDLEGGRERLSSYVLKPLNKVSRGVLAEAVEEAKEACYLWLDKGIAASMNKFNSKVKVD